MKYRIAFGLLYVIFTVSCKKTYTCHCNTLDIHQTGLGVTYINDESYLVKERTREKALSNCSLLYDASGKATGGIFCSIQ